MEHDTVWMREALLEAEKALDESELPIGAILVTGGGEILVRSRAADFAQGNRSSHAEIRAITGSRLNAAARRSGLAVYTTLEPCVMCAAAILIEGINRVVYSLDAPQDGGTFIFDDATIRSRCFGAPVPSIVAGILREEAARLFTRYAELFPENRETASFARMIAAANT